MESIIASYEKEVTKLSCRGSDEDPAVIHMQINILREMKNRKQHVVEALEDEQKMMGAILHSANYSIANCIGALRKSNLTLEKVLKKPTGPCQEKNSGGPEKEGPCRPEKDGPCRHEKDSPCRQDKDKRKSAHNPE